ncbi:PREDICTED: 39S ribosomal protein L51, mitochondrial [Thamnophis sirtalis]|uniref:Large ribosomal subunit protein mL51 n=2 Tax=Thamnophis TaxID=34999 RepID=A0A6I9YFV9_9SAUR|nr:PREDICTED: 39S ribosomal protein L51, mitochondrial [Thamnophis sirtalis]
MAPPRLWTGSSSSSLLVSTARRLFSTEPPKFLVKEPPPPKVVDRWNEKRALFGVYDNIGILGDFKAHPKNLIVGPEWLRGWRGNELQRCIRRKKMEGDRMFVDDYHNLNKRIKFLYKRYNRYRMNR